MRASNVFGACVIIASVFSSGCASINKPMDYTGLDEFYVDCKKKEEQTQLLLSMRSTRDDRLFAWISNVLQPWQMVTDPDQYASKQNMVNRMSDWQINQHLIKLRQCP